MTKKYLPQVAGLMRAGNLILDNHPEALLPFRSTASIYSAPAATPRLPAVELQLLGKRASATQVCFDTLLTAPRAVDRIVLWFPPNTLVNRLTIHGQALSDTSPKGWKRFSSSGMDGGLDTSFCLDPKGGNDLYLEAVEYGLPPAGSELEKARGNATSAEEQGDETLRFEHIRMKTE